MTEEVQDGDLQEVVETEGGEEVTTEPTTNPEAEAEARKYGWRPKEEFDRDPKGWVDAERYLELPSTGKKMVQDELRETKAQFAERMERIERTNKETLRRALEAQKAQHDAQLEDVRKQRRDAAAEGDTDRYDQLDSQERALLDKAPKMEVAEDTGPDTFLEQYSATDEGKWIKDPILFEHGRIAIAGGLASGQLKSADTRTQVEFAKNAVKAHFPEKFEPPKQKHQKVDGGGLAGGRLGTGKLPPEALKEAKECVEQGLYKSVDEYAKFYFSEAN